MAGSSRSNSWMCLLIKLIIRGQQQKKATLSFISRRQKHTFAWLHVHFNLTRLEYYVEDIP